MSYKEKFSASEQKAHSRFIATKIHQEMSKLRAGVEASPATPKRWVWELIQNAKDVNIGGKVRVIIEADLEGADSHVTFRHNGGPFSAENVRFLIEQVSSKDRTIGASGRPTTTGMFGTGFLTTHLLSEKVRVFGVVSEPGLAPRKFELLLDRSGSDLQAIIAAVEVAKNLLQDIDDRPPFKEYEEGEFNTTLRYELTDKTGQNVARAGLKDLGTCLPYTLAFVREIESACYSNHLVSLQTQSETADLEVRFLTVASTTLEGENTRSLAVLKNDLTMIAVPIEQSESGVRVLPLGSETPRLFCDFPLLGTEGFPFPVVINNPTFIPTEPRDGVFLTKNERSAADGDHNRAIIINALSLYLKLVDYASKNEWHDLHLLAAVKRASAAG